MYPDKRNTAGWTHSGRTSSFAKVARLILGALLCTMAASKSFAITSQCAPGYDPDSFYHRVGLSALELSYPYSSTWMETQVSGPVAASLFSVSYGALNFWHWFVDMPAGFYFWYGFYGFGYYGDLFSSGLCSNVIRVAAPKYCESTEARVTRSDSLTSQVHGYLVNGIRSGFEALENLGACTVTSMPTFSGSLQIETLEQCCESSASHESSTRASGVALFSVPGLSCSLKQIIVPAYGIVLEGSIGAQAAADFRYTGSSNGMCGADVQPITLSGSVSGGFGGEVGVGGIDTQVIGAGVSLSDQFTLSASGPDVYTLSVSGCIGPAAITGWVRFLGNEYRTDIVPEEWAEGTRLCF